MTPIPKWKKLPVNVRLSKEKQWNIIADALNSLNGEEEVVTPTTYDISITVNDGTNAIQSASVVIGETTKTTGSQGGCTFTGLTAGEKSVTVTATGYTEKTTTLTVGENSTSFTISLEAVSNSEQTQPEGT